ncbi:MAG TPA: hypothetical protein VGO67_15200 [Verrucomicrobiae bacterium]
MRSLLMLIPANLLTRTIVTVTPVATRDTDIPADRLTPVRPLPIPAPLTPAADTVAVVAGIDITEVLLIGRATSLKLSNINPLFFNYRCQRSTLIREFIEITLYLLYERRKGIERFAGKGVARRAH